MQQRTQVLLKKFEFWGGLLAVVVTTAGPIIVAIINRRPEVSPVRVGLQYSVPAVGLAAIGLFILFVIPKRIQPALDAPSPEFIAAYVRQETRAVTADLDKKLSMLGTAADSLRREQIQTERSVQQVVTAARESRGRMPTESYVLDRLAHLEDQLATDRLELARVQSAVAVAPSGLASTPLLVGLLAGTVTGFMLGYILLRRRMS